MSALLALELPYSLFSKLTWPCRYPCIEKKMHLAQGSILAEKGALPLGNLLSLQALGLGVTNKI